MQFCEMIGLFVQRYYPQLAAKFASKGLSSGWNAWSRDRAIAPSGAFSASW
jgi:hypothetical protein